MSVRVPNMCGNELENDGAAWIAGKEILPIGSLRTPRACPHARSRPKANTAEQTGPRRPLLLLAAANHVRVGEPKDGARRVEGDGLFDLENVGVHVPVPPRRGEAGVARLHRPYR